MKQLTLAALLTLSLGATQAAYAGNDSGFYLGGSIGNSSADESSDGAALDDSDTGYKVFGGYNFGLVPLVDLALEASYLDFGTQTGDVIGEKFDVSSTGLMASALVGLNFGPFGMFAKAGVLDWESDVKVLGFGDTVSGTDPAYGVGAKFQLGSFQLRAEYEVLDLDGLDMDFYSVGAAYTF